jgi:hypothetical protein
MLRLTRKGQGTAEYAIVIGLVIAAAVAMQVYVKRGIQGKVRDLSDANVTSNNDDSGSLYGVNTVASHQYEPRDSIATGMVSVRNATEYMKMSAGGDVTRNITGNEISSREGVQETLNVAQSAL